MKKTKKVIANILDRVAKVAATHAVEIAREVAISLLTESNPSNKQTQKRTTRPSRQNATKKARPKRTAPVKNKQTPGN